MPPKGMSLAFLACVLLCQQPIHAQTTAQSPGETPHEAVSKASDHPDPDALVPAAAGKDNGEDDEDQAFPLRRSEWFVQQRAFPYAHIPQNARWRAIQQKAALRGVQPFVSTSAKVHPEDSFTSAAWNFDGPQPFAYAAGSPSNSGRATSIAINPTTPTTMYLGTAAGGVWKTTDGGVT